MTPLPLGEVRLTLGSHLSALWWLGLLYRRPLQFRRSLEGLTRRQQPWVAVVLMLHALPWIFGIAVVGRLISSLGGHGAVPAEGTFFSEIFSEAVRLAAIGLAYGLAYGLAVGLAVGLAYGLAGGLAVGLAGGLAYGLAVGLAVGLAGGLAFGLAGGLAFGLALTRAYYYPAHVFFVWPVLRGRSYPRHPAAWDDMCSLPFLGLGRLLAAYAEVAPQAAEREIERLIDTYPSQQHQALIARTILLARAAGVEADLARIDRHLKGLPEGEKGFLKQTAEVRDGVDAIARQQRELAETQLPAFRRQAAAGLAGEIRAFRGKIAGFEEPLKTEFRRAAERWLAIAEKQNEAATTLAATERVPGVFQGGRPITRGQAAFQPRLPVIERLYGQITSAAGCPGLHLYGRRRMGKTTLLRNLADFLPGDVRIALFELEDSRVTQSLSGFLGRVAGAATTACGLATEGSIDTVAAFMDVLERVDRRLAEQDRRFLLAFDEFEAIDLKIGEGVFPEDLLRTIRQSIQSHPRIIWLFAGGSDFDELPNAKWASHLVNIQKIEIPLFSAAETRELLNDPLKSARRGDDGDGCLPAFNSAFWGEHGVETIHQQSAGWPNFVQLLAQEAVYLANEQGLDQVDEGLLQRAADAAIVSGDNAFEKILVEENRLDGGWEYLLGFRTSETQPAPTDDKLRRSLRRRLLVVEVGEAWTMRVPLMRRWLVKRR